MHILVVPMSFEFESHKAEKKKTLIRLEYMGVFSVAINLCHKTYICNLEVKNDKMHDK